jgi:hypothetical protein
MMRLAAAAALLTMASVPSFACDWMNQSTSVAKPSTTAAAQSAAPADCPTCLLPDHSAAPKQTMPAPQTPS